MTRAGRRLVEDFLLPALESGKYGELLKWVDRDKRCFSIRWSHKNAAKWSYDDTQVFQDWDSLKGHYNPHLKGYFMQAKQRFRAALYKLNSVVKVPCDEKHVKKYQLVSKSLEKKKSEYIARSKARMPKKEENQKAIPTSVICENTSYTGKQNTACSEPASSPPSSPENDLNDGSEDKELQRCLLEYTLAQKRHMEAMQAKENQNSVLQEESSPMEMNDADQEGSSSQRVPHIPIQPAPLYPSMTFYYDSDQQRFESPKILLVRTYHEPKEPEDNIRVGCMLRHHPPATSQESDALNLSMKSDNESSSR